MYGSDVAVPFLYVRVKAPIGISTSERTVAGDELPVTVNPLEVAYSSAVRETTSSAEAKLPPQKAETSVITQRVKR